ncbi:MAG: hypothetical protein AAGD14_09200 [Planctomycetota bacterium]
MSPVQFEPVKRVVSPEQLWDFVGQLLAGDWDSVRVRRADNSRLKIDRLQDELVVDLRQGGGRFRAIGPRAEIRSRLEEIVRGFSHDEERLWTKGRWRRLRRPWSYLRHCWDDPVLRVNGWLSLALWISIIWSTAALTLRILRD